MIPEEQTLIGHEQATKENKKEERLDAYMVDLEKIILMCLFTIIKTQPI